MPWIQTLLLVLGAYLALGVVAGGIGVWFLAPRSDPALRHSPRSVRLLLWPAAAALWPVVVPRWLRGGGSA